MNHQILTFDIVRNVWQQVRRGDIWNLKGSTTKLSRHMVHGSQGLFGLSPTIVLRPKLKEEKWYILD